MFKDKKTHDAVMEQMHAFAEEDIRYKELVILADHETMEEIDYVTLQPSGDKIFCDAKVIEVIRTTPYPVVVPKYFLHDVVREVVY